ncbi:MAG: BACON domain-containing protein [Chitinophagaceae bacterium]
MKRYLYLDSIIIFCAAILFQLPAKAQSSFPSFPPKNVTATVDRDQMMSQVGVFFPKVLPRLEDKNAAKNSWPVDPKNPEGNWTDSGAHVISRSSFGMWNNYDEALAGNYTPINLLKMKNGTIITTANDWWTKRRPEMFYDIQNEIWGFTPDKSVLPSVKFSVKTTTGGKGNNAYIQKEITGKIDLSRYPQVKDTPVISAILRTPANATGPVPVMIVYGGFGNAVDAYWARTNPNGWGVCIYNPTALQPDNGVGLTSYLIGLVNKGNWRKPTDWGTLAAWAWGVGKLIDYFETDKLVDAKNVGVAGHSRYGKGAIVAMAYEPRVAISYPSCGGALGPSMIRRHWGQDLENIGWDREYHWAAGNFFKYMGPLKEGTYKPRKVELLTVDAHSLVALCAPKPVFLNGGTEDGWSDPYGTYLTGKAVTPVYELLGKKGIIMNDAIPVPNTAYIDGTVGYRNHIGGHTDAPDWSAFFEFAAKHIKASILQASSSQIILSDEGNNSSALKITANEDWKITNTAKWLTLSKTSSSQSDEVVLTAAKNTGASGRSATILITSKGRKLTIVVNQASAKPTLSLAKTDILIAEKDNSTTTLPVNSNTAWTVSGAGNWLNVDEGGVNSKTVNITATANPGTEKRMDTLTIAATGVPSQTIIVTQKEGPPTLNIATTSANLAGAAGSSFSFFVIANTNWSIVNSEPWLKANVESGASGFRNVSITATENTTGAKRTARITVNVKGLAPHIIEIAQEPK